MALEIERKFLVANDGWKHSIIRSMRIRDGLIANNKGHKARVRIADGVATIALKSRRRGPVRDEFEYAIPLLDAEKMLRTMCDGNVLDKVRHFTLHAGNTWHVRATRREVDGSPRQESGQGLGLQNHLAARVIASASPRAGPTDGARSAPMRPPAYTVRDKAIA